MDNLLLQICLAFFQVFLIGMLLYFAQGAFNRVSEKYRARRHLQEKALTELNSKVDELRRILEELTGLLLSSDFTPSIVAEFNHTLSEYRTEFRSFIRFWTANEAVMRPDASLEKDYESIRQSFQGMQAASIEGKYAEAGDEMRFQLNELPLFNQKVTRHLLKTR